MDKRMGGLLVLALLAVVAAALVRPGAGGAGDVPDPLAGTSDGSDAAEPFPTPSPTPSPDASVGGVFVMWARGGLPLEIARQAAELPQVAAASFAVTDTVGLLDARDADGTSTRDWPEGYRIPMSIAAIDPVAYAATLPDPDARDGFPAFAPGQVVMSQTAAARRHLDVGGQIDLVGRPGLEVAEVLPDAVLRATEVLVHLDDAEALDLPDRGSLVVRHQATPGVEAAALADALEALAPEDVPARVVGGGVDGQRHSAPLVLSLTELKSTFGEFAFRPGSGRDITIDPAWVEDHIVVEEMPLLGNVRCHRDIMDDLRAALEEVIESDLADFVDPSRYGGCFYPRRISEQRDRLSSHSWGIAVDINVDMSLPGLGEIPPEEFIEIFGRHNFRWGGDFVVPDNHHYEWLGPAARDRPDPVD